jgi:hypothetical protein
MGLGGGSKGLEGKNPSCTAATQCRMVDGKMNQSLHVRESNMRWSQVAHWCLWWLVGLTCSFSLFSLALFSALFLFFSSPLSYFIFSFLVR